jgi:hypothetical protein
MAVTIYQFVLARLHELEIQSDLNDPEVKNYLELTRYICEIHGSWPVMLEGETKLEFEPTYDFEFDRMTASMSKQVAFITEQKYRETFGEEPPTAPIMRHIAVRWAHHPDYQIEWAPTT